MTMRQKVLKVLYPFITWVQRGRKNSWKNNDGIAPPVSFYSLQATLSSGKVLPFETFQGKKVLLVNTASDCGYTAQYAELQKLYQHTNKDLQIIAFPANDFKEQEKGSDEEIASFCSVNYGVRFPLAKKAVVVKSAAQHPVFQWLTDKAKNGWNDKEPSWNFTKYLINEKGILTHYFEPAASPIGEEMLKAVNA